MKDYTKGRSPEMLEPFFPNEIFKHIIVSCFLLVIEFLTVILFPLPFKVADKMDHISWFLLPIYKLNKVVQNEFLFISILVICALLFISWPFLASDKIHNLLFSFKQIKAAKSCHVWHTQERYKLWQKPIQFTIVIVAIISVIQLCLY